MSSSMQTAFLILLPIVDVSASSSDVPATMTTFLFFVLSLHNLSCAHADFNSHLC